MVAYAVRVARRDTARKQARAVARAWHSYLDIDQEEELLAALLSSARRQHLAAPEAVAPEIKISKEA